MRVLIGFECSGIVRRAFAALGHDAWSIDLKPSLDRSNKHIVGDIREYLDDGWNLLAVLHPPCTRLTNSGVRWLSVPPRGRTVEEMWHELDDGADLFSLAWNADTEHGIERIAVENPIMHRHAKERIRNYQPPAQIVQPWWFGDPFFKATGLYLKKLPPLVPTQKLAPPASGSVEHKNWSMVHRAPPGPDRSERRSRFFPGVASAMALQWGGEVA